MIYNLYMLNIGFELTIGLQMMQEIKTVFDSIPHWSPHHSHQNSASDMYENAADHSSEAVWSNFGTAQSNDSFDLHRVFPVYKGLYCMYIYMYIHGKWSFRRKH